MAKQSSLKKQLLKTNLLVVIIILFLIFGLFLLYYIHTQNEVLVNQSESVLKTILSQLDVFEQSLDNIALQISSNVYICNEMKALYETDHIGNIFLDDISKRDKLQFFLWSYILRKDIASRICIYNVHQDFLYSGNSISNPYLMNDYVTPDRIAEINHKLDSGLPAVCKFYERDPLFKNSGPDSGFLSVIRPVKDSMHYSTKTLAYVEVQLSLQTLNNSITALTPKGYAVKICNKESGETVLDLYPDTQFLSHSTALCEGETKNGTLHCVLKNYSNQVLFNVLLLVFSLLLLYFMIILVVYWVEKRMISTISYPLQKLFDQTKLHGLDENIEISIDENAPIEIYGLQTSFVSMLTTLKHSADELIVAQTGKLRSQLLALQAQVDPHFIHNTLSVISSLAEDGQPEKVASIVDHLSSMIRYSTSFETPFCSIDNEIQHAKDYLELLKYRFENCFFYNICKSENGNTCQIPRFVVQPLLENALKHSLKYQDYPWIINIDYSVSENEWRIRVVDNGVGISKETASEIMLKIYQSITAGVDYLVEQLKIGGMSLLNIAARLYLTYGDNMIFSISPDSDGGTCVIVGGSLK